MKYLYHVSQLAVNGYDTYYDFVCCAESEDQARRTYPGYFISNEKGDNPIKFIDGKGWAFMHYNGLGAKNPDTGFFYEVGYVVDCSGDWPDKLEDIFVALLGIADESIKIGVICASYHAG